MANKNWGFRILIIISLSSALCLFSSHYSILHTSNPANPKKELKEIQKRLLQEKRKIKLSIKKEKSILEEIEHINKVLSKKLKELQYYNERLAQIRSKIKELENEIALLNIKLDKRKDLLKQRLRSLYKHQHGEIASILISAKDYQDLTRRIRYISLLAYYDSKLMKTYNEEINELNVKKNRLAILQKELEINKSNVKKKADEMEAERKKKDQLLASIRKKRDSYEAMVKELEESSKRLRNMIKKLESARLPPSIMGKKGFVALKRRLPWPINGEVIVPFGKYKDPKFNISTFRKGIEIRADIGDIVLSVAGGRVVYANWFKGYGLLLIINHGGGYHTLYAHLSEIFHKTGDIIKSRQAIGKIGETGLLNEPSLYFEIRYKGKPVNPLQWLRKK
jgi:septal ring factor EnvC (AmiA/AmiB activator)